MENYENKSFFKLYWSLIVDMQIFWHKQHTELLKKKHQSKYQSCKNPIYSIKIYHPRNVNVPTAKYANQKQ